jgi:hypothetical protein
MARTVRTAPARVQSFPSVFVIEERGVIGYSGGASRPARCAGGRASEGFTPDPSPVLGRFVAHCDR